MATSTPIDPTEGDSDRFFPPPPPEEFASSSDGESQSDSCELTTPPSGFRENGDEVSHSSGDEGGHDPDLDPVTRARDEIQAAVIDELKQGRVALKHNPASYNPSTTTTRFHAVEMIY